MTIEIIPIIDLRNLITNRSLITIIIRKAEIAIRELETLVLRMIKMENSLIHKKICNLIRKKKRPGPPKMEIK